MAVANRKSLPASPTDLLASVEAYTERPQSVELVETHISWVFLTGRYAYKLKKPLKLDGIDYSTVALRREACVNELLLNRRLTEDVYHATLPITRGDSGRLSLNGGGVPVDWVVKMRQLPEARNLRWLMENNQLRPQDIECVGKMLAEFFVNRPPETVLMETFGERLAENIHANQAWLENHVPTPLCPSVRKIHAVQLAFLASASDILHERVGDGRIIDGHGDLRPEHIFIEHTPKVIDCIEFNRELRQIDAVDDLCFLLMECDRLGQKDVGEALLAEYERRTGDEVPEPLCAFYKCYRACVRAKVASIRADQLIQASLSEAAEGQLAELKQYLQLAEQYAIPHGRLIRTGRV